MVPLRLRAWDTPAAPQIPGASATLRTVRTRLPGPPHPGEGSPFILPLIWLQKKEMPFFGSSGP